MIHSTDNVAADLLKWAFGDLLYRVRVNELWCAVVRPAQVLLEAMFDVSGKQKYAWAGCSPEELPHAVWDDVRKRYPQAAVFPLGSVAERAVKRFLGRFVQSVLAENLAAEGQRKPPAAAGDTVSRGRVLLRYLAYFLFEAAMLDLRGHSGHIELDYGFWYHWTPSGRLRSLDEENQLRERLWGECRRLAFELLQRWAKIRRPGVYCPTEQDIAIVCRDVLERDLMELPAWRRVGTRRQVSAIGFIPTAEHKKLHGPVRYDAKLIVIRGSGANVELNLDELAQHSGGKLNGLLLDLIEIATTVYLADIHVPRHRLLYRDLVFLMPVRYPEIWTAHAEALARVVSFLSRNFVEFRFSGGRAIQQTQAKWRVASDERCVSLFSGGLDSFVGATRLLADKREAMLVSHHPAPKLRGIQKRLVETLRKQHGALVSASVRAGRAGKNVSPLVHLDDPPPQVLYQHTRSFFFLSLASAVAIENGIADVYMPENGPVALNPAFSEARFNTRTTHAVFFEYFGELIRRVFGVELRFHNPFALMTKGEVLSGLEERWTKDLKLTNSCWSYAKAPIWAQQMGCPGFHGGHCGRCLPCIWRRAAVLHAGMTALDDSYLWDQVPDGNWGRWLDRRHLTGLLDQLRFCQRALVDADGVLVDLCPDFYDRGPETVHARLAMYRRFAREMVDWFETSADRMRYELA